MPIWFDLENARHTPAVERKRTYVYCLSMANSEVERRKRAFFFFFFFFLIQRIAMAASSPMVLNPRQPVCKAIKKKPTYKCVARPFCLVLFAVIVDTEQKWRRRTSSCSIWFSLTPTLSLTKIPEKILPAYTIFPIFGDSRNCSGKQQRCNTYQLRAFGGNNFRMNETKTRNQFRAFAYGASLFPIEPRYVISL